MPDDAELLRRYVDRRDEAAFTALVERHVGLVYGAALRQLGGATHRAEDVAQTVFVDLARRARALASRTDLSGWLYTSTHYTAAKLKRSEQRRQAREEEAHFMQQIDSRSSAADWEQLRPVLDDALLTLPERDREALLLRFFHGRKLAEVGRALTLSEDAARMRVDRALEKLRSALSRRGVTSTAAALGLTLSAHAGTAAPAGLAASVASAAVLSGSALASAGPLLTVVQFMSTSKLALSGAALVAVLTVSTAVREVLAERAAMATLAVAQRDDEALHARLRDQQQRLATVEKIATDIRRTKQAEADQKKAVAEQKVRDAQAFMLKHPEVKQALLAQLRARAASAYAGLFRELALSPEQIERFKDSVTQGHTGTWSSSASDSPFVPYHTGGDRAEALRELQALLGPAGFARYQLYDSGSRAIMRSHEFAGILAGTSTPLTATQAQQVQRVLLENRTPWEGAAEMRFEWETILREARTLLSPAQLALLETYRDEDAFKVPLYNASRKEAEAARTHSVSGP